ncbi:hypothetical protein TNCV_4023541 [Trichonephila clavipes]|nr:hypothetical protein TNCV_4023541 [Trichonephila clavipes]
MAIVKSIEGSSPEYAKISIILCTVVEAQWMSGSVSRFHPTGPDLKSRAGKVRLSFSFLHNVLINEYQACAWELNAGGLRHTDHLTWKSAHAPQRPRS